MSCFTCCFDTRDRKVYVERDDTVSHHSFFLFRSASNYSGYFSTRSDGSQSSVMIEYKGEIFRSLLESLLSFMTINAVALVNKSESVCQELHKLINENVADVVNFAELYSLLAVHGWIESGSNFFSAEAYSSYTLQRGIRVLLSSDREVLATEDTISFSPDVLCSIFVKPPPSIGSLFINDSDDVSQSSRRLKPSCLHFDAAVMLADISGFTKLSCSYCKQGREGLDKLHATVNGFLAQFVQIVYAHGGDVIAFAGDALLCIFRSQLDFGGKASMKPLCIRAVLCAMKLKDQCTAELTAHIAVSCGSVGFASLGGFNGEWTYLMNGACIAELSNCIDEAKAKEVVVTNSVRDGLCEELVEEDKPPFEFESCPTKMGNTKILSITPITIDAVCNRFSKSYSEGLINSMKKFLPRPAMLAIQSNCLASISELRKVTTLFLKIDSYCPVANRDPLTLQPFFLVAQKALVDNGGYLRQFLIDDKGCVLIAMWGVPTASSSYNSYRAVQTAVNIRNGAQDLNMKCSMGITTGDIFCGDIGSSMRRDYVGIGDKVNLSARLMGKSKGKIYIDKDTCQLLPVEFQNCLQTTEALTLKGIRKPIHAYCWDHGAEDSKDYLSCLQELKDNDGSKFLQSHVKEILNRSLIRCTEQEAEVSVILVEGAAGSGKHMAAQYFQLNAEKMELGLHSLCCTHSDCTKQYSMARKLLFELCFQKAIPNESGVAAYIEDLFAEIQWNDNGYLGTVSSPLIYSTTFAIFGIDCPGSGNRRINRLKKINSFINGHDQDASSMRLREDEEANIRFEQIFRFVIQTLLLKRGKTVITIESIHFCDECSWALLHAMLEMPVCCVILISKSMDFDMIAEGGQGSFVRSQSMDGGQGSSIVMRSPSVADREEDDRSLKGPLLRRLSGRKSRGSFVSLAANILNLFSQKSGANVTDLSQAYLNVLDHPNTVVLKIAPLDFVGVRDLLNALLGTSLSDDVVQNVLDVSSGNPYWCEEISHFITAKGVNSFLKAVDGRPDGRTLKSIGNKRGALQSVVVNRIEQLSSVQKVILKYASVMSEQFTLSFLLTMLPLEFTDEKTMELDGLIANRFISTQGGKDSASGELLYGFQNKLIRDMIREMTPASDISSFHHQIGEHLETIHAADLEPYYAVLGHHYSLAGEADRVKAIHLFLKAAYSEILDTAFIDAAGHCQDALRLADNGSEVKFVKKTVDFGGSELQKKKMRLDKLRFRLRKQLGDSFLQESKAYRTLQIWVKKKLDDVTAEADGMKTLVEEEEISGRTVTRRSIIQRITSWSDIDASDSRVYRSSRDNNEGQSTGRTFHTAFRDVVNTTTRKVRAKKIAVDNETIDADLRELLRAQPSEVGSSEQDQCVIC